jgi:CheY-like chemotaxis protein
MLATGRRLVETQGGTVEVQRHEHGGMSVVAALPPARTRCVLVVDDNPDLLALFRRYLRDGSYRLIQTGTAESAVRLASELKPDAIILDLMIPSQDGWEILQRLRTSEATCEIPVIVCSVLPENVLARSLGVQVFLAKPVTRTSLVVALERCLGTPRQAARPGRPSDSSPLLQ